MNHLYSFVTQERVLHEISQPVGTCHNSEILIGREEFLLQGIVLHRTIQNRIRIEVVQWAVVATRLPSHTILGHEVEAMTGECPTVMERPHHLDVRIVQIAEQQLIVHVMIMNVMEADDIRLQLLDMPDERLCSPSPLAFSL